MKQSVVTQKNLFPMVTGNNHKIRTNNKQVIRDNYKIWGTRDQTRSAVKVSLRAAKELDL